MQWEPQAKYSSEQPQCNWPRQSHPVPSPRRLDLSRPAQHSWVPSTPTSSSDQPEGPELVGCGAACDLSIFAVLLDV